MQPSPRSVVLAFIVDISVFILEDEKCHLSEVKVDKVPRFMRDIRAKVTADNDMPSCAKAPIKVLLHIGSDILFDVVFFHRGRRCI